MKENKILQKLQKNKKLDKYELYTIFNGYIKDEIDDAFMTEVLKLICKNGLTEQEIFDLTDIFIGSGDTFNFPENSSYVDKHSTGGVGDKTTLIVAPLVAACGVKMAKMSGKALGYTGGTIDKLNSIEVNTSLTSEEFLHQANQIGIALTGQTHNLCPMDKKVYALRDVTGTTSSIALIAVSIMSKKIASGAKKILIDVKVGNGALIDNLKDAKTLAKLMVKIGKAYNREVICLLTRMDNPLGDNIGNKIEILEVIDILKNEKQNNLSKLCITMASYLVAMGKNISIKEAEQEVMKALETKKAYEKFYEWITAQNGNLNIILNTPNKIMAKKEGYITSIDALTIGKTSMELGAGRKHKEDEIDYNAGIILTKNVGDFVTPNDILCMTYGKNKINEEELQNAFTINKKKTHPKDLLIKVIK